MRYLYFWAFIFMLTLSVRGQTTLVQWDFNSTTADNAASTGTTTPSIDVASGTISALGTTTSFASGTTNGGSTDPAPTDDSGFSLTSFPVQSVGSQTKGLAVSLNTTGHQNIQFSFDLRFSNTSSKLASVQYSIDGGVNWLSFGIVTATGGDTWMNNNTFNLPASANDIANLQLRVVSTFGSGGTYEAANSVSTYGASGTWRFDMVTVKSYDGPLPVNLVSFNGKSSKNEIVLSWVTAWEKENQGFEIQKSTNAKSFERVGAIAGKYNSQVQSEYEFVDTDVLPGQTYYYRLKQKDVGGTGDLSRIIAVLTNGDEQTGAITLFPNPGKGNFTLSGLDESPKSLKLYSPAGIEIPVDTAESEVQKTIGISAKTVLAPGQYYLQINTSVGAKSLKVIVH